MNHDDERDYAEERANLADMRREQEAEAAFEALAGRVASALRDLAADAYRDAGETSLRLTDEVVQRLAPNVHRYELLARQQHTALLAATAANAVEEFVGYDFLAGVQGVIEAYAATHMPARQHLTVSEGLLDRALRAAVAAVLGAAQSVLDAEEQREQDARDAADLAETERSLR
jgi:hypothetical protein